MTMQRVWAEQALFRQLHLGTYIHHTIRPMELQSRCVVLLELPVHPMPDCMRYQAVRQYRQ
jgi:hypothetical protein